MGAADSKSAGEVAKEELFRPPGAPQLCGLDNLGNTCYCNAVVQMLYACTSLRDRCMQVYRNLLNGGSLAVDSAGQSAVASSAVGGGVPGSSTLLYHLGELFHVMSETSAKKKRVAPTALLERIRARSTVFRGSAQQDAHEFAMFLIHALVDDERALLGMTERDARSPIQAMFTGATLTRTYCVLCDSVTSVTEPLVDLNLDIVVSEAWGQKLAHEMASTTNLLASPPPAGSGLEAVGSSASLHAPTRTPPTLSPPPTSAFVSSIRWWTERWSDSVYLTGEDRFRCDACNTFVDARRKTVMKRAPRVLLIQLKRFKFHERTGAASKIVTCVPFAEQLVISEAIDGDVRYRLCAIVTHQGASPYSGHYYTISASSGSWYLCNDSQTAVIPFREMQRFYGPANEGSAYLFLYERCVK